MPFEYNAKWVRTVDSDTVHLDLDLGFGIWRYASRGSRSLESGAPAYRLARIDGLELSELGGREATEALTNVLITAKSLVAQTFKSDNFGRYIIEILADGKNVSDWLVENGFAVYKTY